MIALLFDFSSPDQPMHQIITSAHAILKPQQAPYSLSIWLRNPSASESSNAKLHSIWTELFVRGTNTKPARVQTINLLKDQRHVEQNTPQNGSLSENKPILPLTKSSNSYCSTGLLESYWRPLAVQQKQVQFVPHPSHETRHWSIITDAIHRHLSSRNFQSTGSFTSLAFRLLEEGPKSQYNQTQLKKLHTRCPLTCLSTSLSKARREGTKKESLSLSLISVVRIAWMRLVNHSIH